MAKNVEFKSGYNFRGAIELGIEKFKRMDKDDQSRASSIDEDLSNIQLFRNPSIELISYFLDKYAEIGGIELFGGGTELFGHEVDYHYFHHNGTIIQSKKYRDLVKSWYQDTTDDSIKVFLKIRCGDKL